MIGILSAYIAPLVVLVALIFPQATNAHDEHETVPIAIQCYQESTNKKDINAYLDCFADDAEMIDVSRTFEGKEKIKPWAEREVMPGGESFKHRKILEESDRYAKTEVNWLSWVVHYSYWWDENGKITKMSLQYAN